MSQQNLITNVDSPGNSGMFTRGVPPMQPMWNANNTLTGVGTSLPGAAISDIPPPDQYQNGLVTNVAGMPGNKFTMFTENNNNEDTFKNYALYGIQTRSALSEVFFSKVNMARIQNQIRYRVWTASDGKYQIGQQDPTELMVIMRAIFLQHGKFLEYQIPEQVQELDRLVVEFTLPKILSEVEQYLGYLQKLETLPVPIDLPMNLSSAGTKTLRSVASTF